MTTTPSLRRVYLTPRQQRELGVAAPTLQLLAERASVTTATIATTDGTGTVIVPTGAGAFIWAALAEEADAHARTLQNQVRALVALGCVTTTDHGRAGVRYTLAPSWWAQIELLPATPTDASNVVRFPNRAESAPEPARYTHPDDYADEAEAIEVVSFDPESAPVPVRQSPPTRTRAPF